MAKYEDEDIEQKEKSAKQSNKIDNFKKKGLSERDATVKALISMKREEDESDMGEPSLEYGSDYPYGLCIRFEDEELDKLGIKELPEVGAAFFVDARAVVKSVSSNQGLDDDSAKRCVELQITEMKVRPNPHSGKTGMIDGDDPMEKQGVY